MQNFIGLYELLIPCSEFAPKCFHFQDITKTWKCSESPRTLCHWAILHCNMSFQTIAGRSDGVFWWFCALSEDHNFFCQIHQNYLVALTRLVCIESYFRSNDGTATLTLKRLVGGPLRPPLDISRDYSATRKALAVTLWLFSFEFPAHFDTKFVMPGGTVLQLRNFLYMGNSMKLGQCPCSIVIFKKYISA